MCKQKRLYTLIKTSPIILNRQFIIVHQAKMNVAMKLGFAAQDWSATSVSESEMTKMTVSRAGCGTRLSEEHLCMKKLQQPACSPS